MRLRLFFHPKVFEELHADTIDWSKIEPVFYQAKFQQIHSNEVYPWC